MSSADVKVEETPVAEAPRKARRPDRTEALQKEVEQLKADNKFLEEGNRLLQEDLTRTRGERNEFKLRVEALEKQATGAKADEAAVEKKYRDKVKEQVAVLEKRAYDAERRLKANQKMAETAKGPEALQAAQKLAAERLQHIVELEKELAKYV